VARGRIAVENIEPPGAFVGCENLGQGPGHIKAAREPLSVEKDHGAPIAKPVIKNTANNVANDWRGVWFEVSDLGGPRFERAQIRQAVFERLDLARLREKF